MRLWALLLLLAVPRARAAAFDEALAAARATPSNFKLRPGLAPDPLKLKIVEHLLEAPAEASATAKAEAEALMRAAAPSERLARLAGLIEYELPPGSTPPEAPSAASSLPPAVAGLARAVGRAQSRVDAALAGLSPKDREELLDFARSELTNQLPDPLRLREGETWKERDEKVLALAASVKVGEILSAGIELTRAVEAALPELRKLKARPPVAAKTALETAYGRVVLGSAGPDVFDEEAALIVDFGGDDIYTGRAAASRPGKVQVIVDLDGNDRYLGEGFGGPAAGILGINILVDDEGDDVYIGQDAAEGAGLFGFGLLWDRGGNDLYQGRAFTQGAGAFGAGLLIDEGGNDLYRASYLSQGAGYVKGAGLLLDLSGDDVYSAGYTEADPRGALESYGRYSQGEVYQSLSQGFATGRRDYAGGGVGLLIDKEGNDHYSADYFGQGAAYWLGWGLLYDGGGNDDYRCRRYCQGAGIHFAVGTLLDAGGNDRYNAWGVAQGCGHDYGLGLLWDGGGDDVYSADWLAMGASNAMGLGLLKDEGGSDRYLLKGGSAGWDEKRSGAGLGLLLDTGEEPNRYVVERSSRAWTGGRWGAAVAGPAETPEAPPAISTGSALYRQADAKEKAFLRGRLEHAQGLGERTRLSELFYAAAWWGIDDETPLAAKRKLLSLPEQNVLGPLGGLLDPKDVYGRILLEEYFIGAEQASSLLKEKLASDDELIRSRAAYYLGSLRRREALEPLLQALRDPSWRVRAMSARGLGWIQSKKFMGRVKELQALIEAGKLGAVQDWCRRGDKAETLAVLAMLGTLDRGGWASLAPGLSAEPGSVEVSSKAASLLLARAKAARRAFARFLTESGAQKGVPELTAALKDSDPEVRRWSAAALGQMEAGEGAKPLARALNDEDYGVREAAAAALSALGAKAELALVPTLADQSSLFKAVALEALGGIPHAYLEDLFRFYLRDPEGPVRLSALQALSEGEKKGLWKLDAPLLRSLRDDKDLWVKGLAADLLEKR